MAQARRTTAEAEALDLGALGLDQAASTVYVELLRSPDAHALEIAKSTHASRASVEAALSQLVRAGLARSSDRPSGVEALRPEAALAQQISLKQRDAVEHVSRLTELREEITDLERVWRRHHRGEVESGEFEIVRGLDAVNERLEALFAGASNSMVGATKFNPLSNGPDPEDVDVTVGLSERGIVVRGLGELQSIQTAEGRERWQQLAGAGEESRFVTRLPVQFRLIDDAIAVVPLDPAKPLVGAVITRAEGFVIAVRCMFDSLWSEATPLPASSRGTCVRGVDRRLPALLASGACDDAIARVLDISARTVRRQVAALMADLGVQSRLQLGIAIERRSLAR